MQPFNIKKSWVYPNIEHWADEILKNLDRVNKFYKHETGVILDVGGGLAPIAEIINSQCYQYILVDPNTSRLDLVADFIDKRKGYGEAMPVDDESVDIILTSSCLQYMNQSKFFNECKRTLKSGGFIAVHENGPMNPIILFARLIQRIIGLFDKKHWNYRNSIKRYYSPNEIDGLKILSKSQTGLLTPFMLYFQFLKIKAPNNLYSYLLKIDDFLFKTFPSLRKFAFLNAVIYVKN